MPNATPLTHARSLILALALGLVPVALSAQAQNQPDQDPAAPAQQQTPQCTMEASPVEVDPGQAAVEVTVQVSEQLGAIASAEPSMESGLALASAEDIPRAELAAGDEEPTPIEMSAEGSSVTLWLNTENAQEGSHQIVLEGTQGSCTSEVTVTGGAQ